MENEPFFESPFRMNFRRSVLLHGRKCRGYRVVNWLTGEVVERAELERVAGVMKAAA